MLAPVVAEVPPAFASALQVALGSLTNLGIYTALAVAYALIYGLIGRIHLALGDLAILAGYGAFIGFWLSGGSAAGLLAIGGALVVGLFTASMHGGALGRLVFERLLNRPGQHILIATLGLTMAWGEALRLVQGNGQRWLSPLLSEPLAVARADNFFVTVTPMSLLVPTLLGLCLAAVFRVMRATRFGRHWQAVADDPLAAALCGVGLPRVLATTMGLSALLAGAAGIATLFAYGGIGHAGGLGIGLKALMAAVIGGIGSVRGAALGAIGVSAAETAWSHLVDIESRDLAMFCALAAVLVLKPDGLFATRSPV